MKNIVLIIVSIIVSIIVWSCAGVDQLKTVKIDANKNYFSVKIPKGLHELRIKAILANEVDYKIKAYVLNSGLKPLSTLYEKFSMTRPPTPVWHPIVANKITINPGHLKLFYEGPLSLLSLTLSSAPFDGGEFLIAIEMDEFPTTPITLKLSGSWGNP